MKIFMKFYVTIYNQCDSIVVAVYIYQLRAALPPPMLAHQTRHTLD